MMKILFDVLEKIGVIGLICVLIGYLAKQIISMVINKDLEKYKANLQEESHSYRLSFEKQIENFKSELSILSNRQFRLDEKRALVIEELYHNMVNLNTHLINLTALFKEGSSPEAIDEEDQKQANKTAELANKFVEHFDRNKIYFTAGTCKMVEILIQDSKSAFFDYTFSMKYGRSYSPESGRKKHSAAKKVRDDIPKSLNAIEEEFRLLTGVNKIKK
ncbi:hypothetical protein [Aquimarina algiphila]|uniref:hypothetical protein n=1 Tax=Aquimarina algiphila TaxID=2047982 RepID=UPI0024923D9C|nr:hypothetical protein [Aquimarina algiphila]